MAEAPTQDQTTDDSAQTDDGAQADEPAAQTVTESPEAVQLAATMAALASPGTTTDAISSGNSAKDMAASVEFQDPFNPSDNPVPVKTLQQLIEEKLATMNVLTGNVLMKLGRNTSYAGAGNDRVGLLTANGTKQTTVDSGAGDDTVFAYINGGTSTVKTGVDQLEITATGEGVVPNPVSVMDIDLGAGSNRADIDMSVGDTYARVDLSGDTAHRVHLTGALKPELEQDETPVSGDAQELSLLTENGNTLSIKTTKDGVTHHFTDNLQNKLKVTLYEGDANPDEGDNQRLTVYNAADNSAAHRWLCTTGRAGYETPTGTFAMPDKKGDERKDWCTIDGYKVRYAVRVADGFYIHSVQYTDKKDDAVRLTSLAKLGHSGSLGSVIVEYAHAKWISQNCPKGTLVVMHAGVNDPLIADRLKGDAGTDTTESLPEPPSVESIALNPSSEFTIGIGETRQIGYTLKPSGAESSIEWESGTAKHATVDGSGVVRGVAEGDATIKARTVNGKEAKVKVKVIDQPKKVSIKNDKTIKVGQTLQLTAEVEPKGTDPSVTWSSADTSIATADGSGKVTGKKKGKVKITVKTVNGKTDTVKIKVEN